MKTESTDQLNKNASVTRKQRYVTVAPSPLNAVKLDLGIIIVLSVIIWVLIPRLIADELLQIFVLAGFGLLAAVWIIFRTRRVMRSHMQKVDSDGEA